MPDEVDMLRKDSEEILHVSFVFTWNNSISF